jgi:hypothetical protein
MIIRLAVAVPANAAILAFRGAALLLMAPECYTGGRCPALLLPHAVVLAAALMWNPGRGSLAKEIGHA